MHANYFIIIIIIGGLVSTYKKTRTADITM